jgi:hypothetical protein
MDDGDNARKETKARSKTGKFPIWIAPRAGHHTAIIGVPECGKRFFPSTHAIDH